ncbi:Prefoldin subunit 4 [Mycena leptocephala]|nr:Prefoldin subunit 4 [Mycena leptocephala]
MNSLRMLEQDDDDAAEVTWEDQQRINSFSKLNTRMRNTVEKLQELKQEKEALEDLATELELADEDEPVLYKADIGTQVSSLSSTVEQCEKEMSKLKVTLYAKFGSAINLDD